MDKQKEKLIEILKDNEHCPAHRDCSRCDYRNGPESQCAIMQTADRLLANNVKVLPCEIGQTYYRIVIKRPKINFPYFAYIRASKFNWYNIDKVWTDFGKTVFLDEEEAKEALREIEKTKEKEEEK